MGNGGVSSCMERLCSVHLLWLEAYLDVSKLVLEDDNLVVRLELLEQRQDQRRLACRTMVARSARSFPARGLSPSHDDARRTCSEEPSEHSHRRRLRVVESGDVDVRLDDLG